MSSAEELNVIDHLFSASFSHLEAAVGFKEFVGLFVEFGEFLNQVWSNIAIHLLYSLRNFE